MGFRKIKDYVPVFYHRFLPSLFDSEIPQETFTKCESCPMVCSSREELKDEVSKPFAPETKCCTFMPRLPNYFVGAFFNDPQTDYAKKELLKKINEKNGVFPQGIYPNKKYALLYELGRKEGFGKSLNLKCSYYLDGEYNCSLWKYRESICATWFCKYIAGEAGKNFWYEMRDIFKTIQEKLTNYVIKEQGLNIIEPYGSDESLSYEDLDDLPMNEKDYKLRWKHWAGKEAQFYLNSYELINNMTVEKFNEITGEDYFKQLQNLQGKYNIIMTLPESLITNPDYTFEEVIPGTYRLMMKSYIDRNDTLITYAFDVPSFVIDCFRKSDSLENILKTLSDIHNVELGKDIIIALYHNDILIEKK